MATSWAISSNSHADDDFFSTIDNPESIWNNGSNSPELESAIWSNDDVVEQISPTVTVSSSSSSYNSISDDYGTNSNISSNIVFDEREAGLENYYELENNYMDQDLITDNNSASEPSSSLSSSIENQDTNDDDSISNKEDTNNYQNAKESIETGHSIDALLAQELNALSFQEREKINEEIHGLHFNVKEIEETPQLLKESFMKLQIELDKLQPNSFAYNRCQQLYGYNKEDNNENIAGKDKDETRMTTYINADDFRIMFLRCDFFNIKKSARRLILYIELLYEMFGDVGMQRRIQMSDLNEEEIRILRLGNLQILPGRDRANRRVVIHIARNTTKEYTVKSRLRISLYRQMSWQDDIESQHKGFVMITYYHNIKFFNDLSTRSQVMKKQRNAIPFRFGAIHICIPQEFEDNTYMNIPDFSNSDDGSDSVATNSSSSRSATPANVIKTIIALSIGTKGRSLLRFHTGSAMECLYALQSFGIPADQIPFVVGSTLYLKRKKKKTKKNNDDAVGEDNNNNNKTNVKLVNHMKWLKLCELKDSNIKSCGKKWKQHDKNCHGYDQQIIECPNHSDILSGRGMDIMKHPGNTVLRSIVVSKLDEYMDLKSHTEKTELTLDVVHLLKNNYGARFLTQETTETNGKLGCWVEISNVEARQKVRIAFRDKIKKNTVTTNSDNYDATIAIASNNTTKKKKKISTNIQRKHKVLIPLTTKPTINSTTNFLSPLSSSLSRTTSLIMEQQTNNNNSFKYHQKIQQQQQQQQQIKEDPDSSTSIFLSMTGVGNEYDNGNGSVCISTGKKRQLPTKSYFSSLDCMNI